MNDVQLRQSREKFRRISLHDSIVQVCKQAQCNRLNVHNCEHAELEVQRVHI